MRSGGIMTKSPMHFAEEEEEKEEEKEFY